MGYAIGKRRYARETYPETGSAGGDPTLARNSAFGPGGSPIVITGAGVQISWSNLEVGSPGVDVPITPRSTGNVRVVGMVGIENITEDVVATGVTVQVEINDAPFGPAIFSSATVIPDEVAEIPFLINLWGPDALPVGTTSKVSLLVKFVGAADTVQLDVDRSSIDVQELPAVTG